MLHDSKLASGISELEHILINVIAMMFDFILADRAIPDVMKAVIGRLQIPILKVAIIDQMFFAKKSHPARKLLNKLAEVGVGWNEENDQDRAVFDAMKNLVQRILNEFDNNIEIFEIVLNDLWKLLYGSATE